jgi:hypothetical protein
MRIKCPHCNGKGFSELNSALNMTCGWCMGQGELDLEIVPTEPHTEAEIEKKWENTPWDTDIYLEHIDDWGVCKDCALKENCAEYKPYKRQCEDYERYKEVLTNEEWLKSANTEQLAGFLSKIEEQYPCGSLLKCDVTCGYHSQCRGDDVAPTNKEAWVEWLKQPHTFK